MPVGDCQRAFAAAAAEDGIHLELAKVPWLNQRGHLGLPEEAQGARSVLEAIFDALGGDHEAQATKRTTPLPGDFVMPGTGTFLEIDEIQQFTSFRETSLRLYPPDTPLGFDHENYLISARSLLRARIGTARKSPRRALAQGDDSVSVPTTMRFGTW